MSTKIILVALTFCVLFGCTETSRSNVTAKESSSIFSMYWNETFPNKISTDSAYILIVGKQICSYCKEGALSAFKIQQSKINANEITLITDFKKNDIDTLLQEGFNPTILYDTLGNFGNYSIPRSYVTLYKVINGKIERYVYFSDDNALNNFLEQENLLIK